MMDGNIARTLMDVKHSIGSYASNVRRSMVLFIVNLLLISYMEYKTDRNRNSITKQETEKKKKTTGTFSAL